MLLNYSANEPMANKRQTNNEISGYEQSASAIVNSQITSNESRTPYFVGSYTYIVYTFLHYNIKSCNCEDLKVKTWLCDKPTRKISQSSINAIEVAQLVAI